MSSTLCTSPRAPVPRRDASESRRQTLVLVLLVWLLGSLLLSGTIFSDVNFRLIGQAGFYLLHVLGHLAIVTIALSLPAARREILRYRAVLV